MFFCDWLFSLNMFSRFIHGVACISTSFLSIAKHYSIVWIHSFYPSSVDGHLSGFRFFAIMNNMDICFHLS